MKKSKLLLLPVLLLTACNNQPEAQAEKPVFREQIYEYHNSFEDLKITLFTEDKCDIYGKSHKYYKEANYELDLQYNYLITYNDDIYMEFEVEWEYRYWQNGLLRLITYQRKEQQNG